MINPTRPSISPEINPEAYDAAEEILGDVVQNLALHLLAESTHEQYHMTFFGRRYSRHLAQIVDNNANYVRYVALPDAYDVISDDRIPLDERLQYVTALAVNESINGYDTPRIFPDLRHKTVRRIQFAIKGFARNYVNDMIQLVAGTEAKK